MSGQDCNRGAREDTTTTGTRCKSDNYCASTACRQPGSAPAASMDVLACAGGCFKCRCVHSYLPGISWPVLVNLQVGPARPAGGLAGAWQGLAVGSNGPETGVGSPASTSVNQRQRTVMRRPMKPGIQSAGHPRAVGRVPCVVLSCLVHGSVVRFNSSGGPLSSFFCCSLGLASTWLWLSSAPLALALRLATNTVVCIRCTTHYTLHTATLQHCNTAICDLNSCLLPLSSGASWSPALSFDTNYFLFFFFFLFPFLSLFLSLCVWLPPSLCQRTPGHDLPNG